MENNKIEGSWKKGIAGYRRDNGDCVTMMQHSKIYEVFDKLINIEKPSRVMEVGTAMGGLTLMIRDLLDKQGLQETLIRTYEVNLDKAPIELDTEIKKGANIEFYNKNLFSSSYFEIANEEIDQNLQNYIGATGTTLILCDGGCKICEVNVLSKYLKDGDIIMAHDYAPNAEYFEERMKDKIWNWMEIQDSDIQQSIDKYNIKNYMQEDFRSVAWYCGKVEK